MYLIKKFTFVIFMLILASSLFQGCAQKINIKAIKASKVTNSDIKYIGVSSFKNDTISQSSQIDSAIGNVIINNTKYFTLVDRENIDKIMKEKRLNDSGLVDLINTNSTTGLHEIKTLVTGEVILNDLSSNKFFETRTNYNKCIKSYKKNNKTYCSAYQKYNVYCKSNIYTVKTKVKLIKIQNSETIFTQTYSKSSQYKHCADDNNILPSKNYINTSLASKIANDLVIDIAPSYVYFTVTLLESINIEISNIDENKFEIALKMIEQKRIKKANKILYNLNKKLNNTSYVILYDLAVTEEALGNVGKAFSLLKKAENITIAQGNIIDEISIAIKRVQKNIYELKKAKRQM